MKCTMKSGDNLVLEFSTSAYELAKTCLDTIFTKESFPHAYEKRDSVDKQGAITDSCYKICNKKADGSCGKKLKFVINLYHTTSQILVNGNKVDVFLTDIYGVLCTEMRSRCGELDILNTNIFTVLDNVISRPQLTGNDQQKPVNSNTRQDFLSDQISENVSDDELEVCELCPFCQQQAYGKTVQCGECGDWYHLNCTNADDASMQALGDDDFVCIACSDNLINDSSVKDKSALHSLEQDNVNDSNDAGSNEASAETPMVKSKTNNQNTHDSCMNSYSPDRNPQQLQFRFKNL